MKQIKIFKITLSGLLLALGIVLPFLTGMQLGSVLCPMHIPILLCGIICGWQYGLLIGIICPLLRSVIVGMPPIYPTAISMSVELGIYGFVSGLLFEKLKNKNLNLLLVCFISLISAQLLGRLGWGLVRFIMGLIDKTNVFTFNAFLSGAFIVAWPGILVQLIIIPILIISLNKAGYIK